MLRTLALISQKGGSGKTTLALALAAAHELAGGQAAVIDLDPQGSATVWGRLREGVPPAVIAAHPPRLARVVEAAADAGASLAVIDTAPREAGGAAEAARLADLVMIPCRPSAIDLAAIPATLAAIPMADAVAVLNACPPRGPGGPRKGVHPRPDGPGNGTGVTGGPRDRGPIPMGNGGSVTKRTLADALQAAAKLKPAAKTIPSRRGKRAWVIYLDRDTARRLKAAAAMSDRSMQSLGVEAADWLIERYGMR